MPLISNPAAYALAASWGSYMTGGDPGACFYGFDESFLLQDGAHRRDCLAYASRCIADTRTGWRHNPVAERAKLRQLKRKLRAAPVDRSDALDALSDFARGYVECALWCDAQSDRDPSPDDLDGWPAPMSFEGCGFSHLARTTLREMRQDCRDFAKANAADLAAAVEAGRDMSHLGHDFWLTRNHHGAGFWDRGLGELGDRLTEAAHSYGEASLYMGDDGRIHA